MEEIDLVQLLRYYFKKLPIIILITILAILLGYFYVEYVQVPMYHGTTTIILVQQSNEKDGVDITQGELDINQKLVSTYSKIIKSRRVIEKVIDELDLKTTTSNLAKSIYVSTETDTYIIKISVSNENKNKAAEISNKVAEVFKDEIIDIYNLKNVSIIDKAIAEKEPYNVHKTKHLILFALAGIGLSVGVIFIIYCFDNTIKTKKDIEATLNLAILGEIPVAKKLEKKIRSKKKRKLKLRRNADMVIINNEDRVNEEKEPKKTKKTTASKKTTTKKSSTSKGETKKSVNKSTSKKSATKKSGTSKGETKKSVNKSTSKKSTTKSSDSKDDAKKSSSKATRKKAVKDVEGGNNNEGINS